MFLSAQFCTLLSTFLCQFKYVQASLILKYLKEKLLLNIILYETTALSPSFTHNLFKKAITSPSVHFLIFHTTLTQYTAYVSPLHENGHHNQYIVI